MKFKLICCDVFTRIACRLVSESPHIVDVEFVKMLAHNEPKTLNRELQERIDRAVQERDYDAVILGFGICGNAVLGLTCPIPLIIPRVHDCCTLFMGSKENFITHFGHALSTRWRSCGYFERCDLDYRNNQDFDSHKTNPEYLQLLEQYDEEEADYVWEVMHPPIETDEVIYIHIDGFEYSGSRERFTQESEAQGKTVKTLQGDTGFIRKLIFGEWDEKQFLTLQPGQRLVPTYDMEQVVRGE